MTPYKWNKVGGGKILSRVCWRYDFFYLLIVCWNCHYHPKTFNTGNYGVILSEALDTWGIKRHRILQKILIAMLFLRCPLILTQICDNWQSIYMVKKRLMIILLLARTLDVHNQYSEVDWNGPKNIHNIILILLLLIKIKLHASWLQ